MEKKRIKGCLIFWDHTALCSLLDEAITQHQNYLKVPVCDNK